MIVVESDDLAVVVVGATTIVDATVVVVDAVVVVGITASGASAVDDPIASKRPASCDT